ncbi:MAG TPA: DUF892 family protein [Chthonomonadaceae bacterium]|nr:DUF892 family protein [Chthonomonadaceae bacterium]
MEDSQDRMIRYLDDAWAMEKALVDNLQSMADEVNNPNIRAMFQQHADETHRQEQQLEARIRALGEEPSGGKGFLNKMMAMIGDAFQGAHDPDDKTTQDLMKAFGIESFEMAMYQGLMAYANAIGDTQTAQLAQQILQQERETANKVWPLIAPTAARPAQDAAAARHERGGEPTSIREDVGLPTGTRTS